mmetsp:Transcript_32876/g.70993  ORF Transcript_32876/g.70993 Transcript_32876/m.70993 type:complete len:622 (+) Transcript_32876:124-1989(+)
MGTPSNSLSGPPLIDRMAPVNIPPLVVVDSKSVLSPPVPASTATQTQETAPNAKTTKEILTDALALQLNLLHFVQEAFFTRSTLISLAIYSGITAVVLYGDALKTNGIVEYLNASKASVGFFNIFLGFSLAFRTNICYTRWWEGRCLWGALIFSAIHIAQQGQCWIKDKENLRCLCCAAVTFPYACKAQLRGATIMEDGAYLLQRGLINPAQLELVSKRNGWQPYYFLGVMRAAINNELEKSTKAKSGDDNYSFRGSTKESQMLIFEDSLKTLATSIGGLIRVKSTGLPAAYDMLFSIIFAIFFLIATLAWAPTLRWYTPIMIGVLRFAVKLILVIGSELEDPFGDDVTDLPMQKFCLAIETQIEAIFSDVFPANSLGGQWPIVMGAAPPNDTTTQYYGDEESSVCLPEMIDVNTSRANFERMSMLSRSQGILHMYSGGSKKAGGDSFYGEGMVPSSQRIMHMYSGRSTKARRNSMQNFNEAGVAEEFVSDNSEDEGRRMHRRRQEKDDKVQQPRKSSGKPSGASAGKKKGSLGNNESSQGKKEIVKLAVSPGSDDTSRFSEGSALEEANMAQLSKILKKLLANVSSTDSSRRDRDSSHCHKKVRSKSCGGDNANSHDKLV